MEISDEIKTKAKEILLYLWQLPQNLIGLLLFQFYSTGLCMAATYNGGLRILYSERMTSGVCLGKYVILPLRYGDRRRLNSYIRLAHKHEYGHYLQSRRLGWLYLVVIAIPSSIWSWAHKRYRRLRDMDYYSFYTERWAERLGGVNR